MTTSALANLPAAVFTLVPELAELAWTEEARADCAHCVMLATAGQPPEVAFRAETRCCTYHPILPNFLVGRALGRSASARRFVEARMEDPSGVSALGIAASARWTARHHQVDTAGWGRDLELRCPYWAGGDATCGIWADRNGACRCWYCKHDTGPPGALEWMRLQLLLERIETRLARHLVAAGPPLGADRRGLLAWFERCADRVDAMGQPAEDALPVGLRRELEPLIGALVDAKSSPVRVLPEVVTAAVSEVVRRGDQVGISGYSSFDAITLPNQVFGFLAALKDGRRWRDILADPRLGGAITAADVAELFRIGAVTSPGEEVVRDSWLLAAWRR